MKSIFVALASAALATTSFAQGSLGVQGFGYPPGQISSRAEAMGGSTAELDELSAVNPASITRVRTSSLYFQYDPEFRTVSSGSASSHTTTARFPIVAGILPLGERWKFSIGSSTLLDRSAQTHSTVTRTVNGIPVDVDQRSKSLGAIDDVRFAIGYIASEKFTVGLGAHIFTGTNQETLQETFPDTSRFSNLFESSRLSYSGAGISVGTEWHPSKILALGVAVRKGGSLRAESADTLVSRANVPDHYSAAVEYTGISDLSLGVRVAHDNWSSMNGLAASGVSAHDAWDVGLGAETSGPKMFSRAVLLRAGIRSRALPFSATGASVRELSFAAGLGIDVTHDLASIDVTLQRANRSNGSSVKEHAYILSFGLRVTP